jgi:hypothetical protein
MAYFHPELLEVTRTSGMSGVRFMGQNPGDSEDPHDQNYLNDTSRKYTKVSFPGDLFLPASQIRKMQVIGLVMMTIYCL